MRPPEGPLHRYPRPLIMCLTALAIAICVFMIGALCIPLWRAINRWADGQPLDWTGAAAMLATLTTLLTAVLRAGGNIFNARSVERQAQIGAGTAAPPFDSLPPGGGQPAENVTFSGEQP